MQLVSSKIWTRVAVFISYDDNNYTTDTSNQVSLIIQDSFLLLKPILTVQWPGCFQSYNEVHFRSLFSCSLGLLQDFLLLLVSLLPLCSVNCSVLSYLQENGKIKSDYY